MAIRTKIINNTLVDLSIRNLDADELNAKAKVLDQVYSSGYRHGYAGILDVIRDIDERQSKTSEDIVIDDEQEMDNLVILTTNLDNLKEHIRNSRAYGENTFNGVVRLSDHVRLEIHRLRDIQDQDYQKQEMMKTIQNLFSKSEELTDEIEIAQKNSEKIQMHMVAILGIFAAIVMAFSGGMNILSGAISISGDSDLCNVVFTVLLCGVILFNVFAFLMGSILYIIRPDGRSSRDQEYAGIANSKLIIGFNGVLIALLAIDAAIMICS